MNLHGLTSYDLFKLVIGTSRVPLYLNHQVQSGWQDKKYPAGLRSIQLSDFS
jgi:hypothetical protein